MINFLLKGVLRDKIRSVLSLIVIFLGVMFSTIMVGFMAGIFNDFIRVNAILDAGHLKIMTRAYDELSDMAPNDLAIIGVDSIISDLEEKYPELYWTPRIKLGGLVDIPDENGETKNQSPAIGIGIDLLSPGSNQAELLGITKSLVRGRLPESFNEALLSEEFSQKLGVAPGDKITLLSSTMWGSFATYNFVLSGTLRFGIPAMDRSTLIVDIEGARLALDMDDASSEILGIFKDELYDEERSEEIKSDFLGRQEMSEFGLLMIALRDQNDIGLLMDRADIYIAFIIGIFVFLVVLVVWNFGLMNGLRRYGEIGIRLAMGETKGHVYRTLLIESSIIGVIGTILGMMGGLSIVYYLQEVGIDYSDLLGEANMLISGVMRAQITPGTYYVGVVPGLFASLLGTALAGRGIYKRELSQLFKELETW
ncbi:MAG: ABC transporter permease [Candidatus Marinimicrobia bacterium]|nr:ABC transporter permease [Candidatus Neomarinimicrobiota bacterium]